MKERITRGRLLSMINDIRKSDNRTAFTTVRDTDSLRKDLGLTSFDIVDLAARIRDEFGVGILEDGLVDTVGEICQRLE